MLISLKGWPLWESIGIKSTIKHFSQASAFNAIRLFEHVSALRLIDRLLLLTKPPHRATYAGSKLFDRLTVLFKKFNWNCMLVGGIMIILTVSVRWERIKLREELFGEIYQFHLLFQRIYYPIHPILVLMAPLIIIIVG